MKIRVTIFIIGLFALSFAACRTSKSVGSGEMEYRLKMAFEERFFEATKARLLENYVEAHKLYAECLKIKPNDDACLYEMARLASQKDKRYKEALDYINRAIKINNSNYWYLLTLAEIQAKQGDFGDAANTYETITEKYPSKVESYYEWANMLLMASKYAEAIKVYNKLEAIIGISEELSLQKEKVYLNLRKYDDAIEEIRKLSEAFPTDSRYMSMLAELYMATKNPDKAKPIYEKLLELNPNDGTAAISLADFYMRINQTAKAYEYLEKAFTNATLDVDFKMKILLDFYEFSEKDKTALAEAYKLGEMMVVAHPNDPKSYSILGDFYYRDKNYAKSREYFEKVITLDNTKYVVWEQLLYIYAQLNDFVAMQEKSKTAMEYFPLQTLPYYFNGFANIQLKQYEKAVKSLNAGKGFVVDNNKLLAEFYSSLGEAYQCMHQYKESGNSYEKALELSPDNAFVLNNYSYYLSLRKERLDKALEMAEKANKLSPNSPSFQDTYGWILYQKGDLVNAEIWIKKSIDNGGDNDGSVLEHYGDIMFKQNKLSEALLYWNRAKEKGGASDKIDRKISEQKLGDE